MTKAIQWLAMLGVACAVSWPVHGQTTRLTPDEFRSRFNLVFRSHDLKMQLGEWKPDSPGNRTLTALITRSIRAIAQQDQQNRLSSVLFVMQNTGTLESATQIVATLVATIQALNPELSEEDREALFEELGVLDEGWFMRGLDGIAARRGVTYHVVHPARSALIIARVSWEASSEPANPLSL